MNKPLIRTGLVFLLIFSITLSQFVPGLASANNNKLRIAFVGLKFKNLPQDIQDILTARLNAILENQNSIILTKPEGARLAFGRKKITDLIEYQECETFLEFAREYQFDHVFSGILENQSSDNDQTLLVGELNRFDLSDGQINRFKINRDYARIETDLNHFNNQYVKSLIKIESTGRKPWTVLLIGGIVVASLLALRVGIGAAFGDSEGGDPVPSDE